MISEVFLCKKEQNVKISKNSGDKRKAMSITVIAMTSCFLIMTLPYTLARGYFLTALSATPAGLSILFLCDSIAFTYHGINFVILYVTNKKFKEIVRNFFKRGKGRVSNSSVEATAYNTTTK